MNLSRLLIGFSLSSLLLIFSAPVMSQDHTSDDVLILPGPASDRVCTYEPTDINAHYFLPSRIRYKKSPAPKILSNFEVTYQNECGDNTWPQAAIDAFEYAVEIWSSYLQSTITIRVEAFWSDLDDGVLGSAAPTRVIHSSNSPLLTEEDTWYPIAQANAMTGFDYKTVIEEEDFDIFLNMNCQFDAWYFGTDANPGSNQIDFVTVALHEIGHGIGFLGTMQGNTGTQTAEWGIGDQQVFPIIYDRFPADGNLTRVINEDVYPNPSSVLYNAVTGREGGLFFNGNEADRMYADQPVPIYAPTVWNPGSSYSHVDDDTFKDTVNGLMRPRIDQAMAIHSPGPIFCGILSDVGWPLGSGCQSMLGREAQIAFSQHHLNFELVNVNSSRELSFSISNITTTEDTLTGRVESSGNYFSIESGAGPFDLGPGESKTVSVSYTPRTVNNHGGIVRIFHNAYNEISPAEIRLEGEALRVDVLAKLLQNYPNPFNDQTTISFGLPEEADVRLDIYDTMGRHIETLVNESLPAREAHEFTFRSGNLSSGMYLYRIVVDDFSETKKLLLIK